jgi:hypothetical protein
MSKLKTEFTNFLNKLRKISNAPKYVYEFNNPWALCFVSDQLLRL